MMTEGGFISFSRPPSVTRLTQCTSVSQCESLMRAMHWLCKCVGSIRNSIAIEENQEI